MLEEDRTGARFMDNLVLRLYKISKGCYTPPGVCTLQGHEVAYPTLLEAVLPTERALFAHLQACRTLQIASLIRAINAHARLLHWF